MIFTGCNNAVDEKSILALMTTTCVNKIDQLAKATSGRIHPLRRYWIRFVHAARQGHISCPARQALLKKADQLPRTAE